MKSKIIFFLGIAIGLSANAFPEYTRFGYNHCLACHQSPAGGAMLTPYGKNVSAEIANTWGDDSQTGLLWGYKPQKKIEKVLLVGGDLRAVQIQTENEQYKNNKFIKMQAEVSAAVIKDYGSLFISVGEQQEETWRPIATSFYAMATPIESLSIRLGRFVPQYGLHISDHFAFIRSFLGFGLQAARDTAEVQWTAENWASSVSYAKQFKGSNPETAQTAMAQYYFLDQNKIAINYWKATSENQSRDLYGFWGSFAYNKNIFLLSEFDWQNTQGPSDIKSSTNYQKLGWTVKKGLDLLLVYEELSPDLSSSDSKIVRKGPGFQWTPIAHFELSGNWSKMKIGQSSMEEDYAWILFHYYL